MNEQVKKTILLVEDEAVTSKLTSKTLHKFGYNVETVNTGEKAIETAISNKNINLILMDIDLGEGIDGTEAALIILSVRNIPVVFLSSHTEPEVVEKTEKITSYGYVVKNSSSTVLDASIKMAFKLFQARAKEKEKEEEYRLLFENASIGIFIAQDNQIKIFNSTIEKSFGHTPEIITSEPFTSFIHPDDREMVLESYARRLKGDTVKSNYPFRIIHGSGEIRWVEITSTLISWKDKPASLNYIIDITDRKLAETESRLTKEALIERENRFQSYFNIPLIGIAITSPDGSWIELNSQFCRMLGYSENELKKLTWTELTYPDDLNTDIEQFENILSGKIDFYSIDKRFIRNDKTIIWGTLGVGCVRNTDNSVNYLVATISDISWLKKIEISNLENENILKTVLSASTTLIDPAPGDVEYENIADTFVEITGAKYASFNLFDENGLDFTTVAFSGMNDKLQKISSILGFDIIKKKWKHDPAREDKIKNQTVAHFDSLHDLTGTVINRKISELIEKTFNIGKVVVIVISKYNNPIGDITLIFEKDKTIRNTELAVLFANQVGMFIMRKQVEDKLITAIQESDILRQKEKEANEAKSAFLTNISHEIRTPMNTIISMTDLALMTFDEKELHDYLLTIKDSGNHLLQIINDILDFSKIESRNMILEQREFHLKNIFHAVEKMYQFEIKKKGLILKLDISDELPVSISGDELRLRQILINLVSNSLKFTEKGTITIKASLKKDFIPDDKFSAIEISVSDTGCGIPKDKQDIIFTKFHQSDNSITRKYGGTGLGLSIVKELVKLMDGDIIVKSEQGNGSEFIFWFTAKKNRPSENIKIDSNKQDIKNMGRKHLNILLAEDNETNIILESTVLKKLGHSVTVARNGLDALNLINIYKFDIVFMDIEMPVMDGIEATKRIRRGECGIENKNICILAMTAHAAADFKKDVIEAGMNDFITKPIDITQIQERIDKIIGG